MALFEELLGLHGVAGGPGPYFGNGSDGAFNPSSNITFTAATEDGAPIIKQFSSINIPASVTVTVDKRCQGLIMLVNGDVTIAGTISMDYKGAIKDPKSKPGYAVADKVYQLYYPLGNNVFIPIGMGGKGGKGGGGGAYYIGGTPGPNSYTTTGPLSDTSVGGEGTTGTWWGGGSAGGGAGGSVLGTSLSGLTPSVSSVTNYGGSGGSGAFVTNGSGGASTAYTNTTGSGSGNAGSSGSGGSGAIFMGYCSGGNGSYGATSGAGGAQGNSAGGAGGGGGMWNIQNSTQAQTPQTAASGSSPTSGYGAGGLILIIASGNITISSGAVLTTNGCNGANGGNANAYTLNRYGSALATGGGGGGGAGGGIICLLYKGNYTNSGTLRANGGAGGTAGSSAGLIGDLSNGGAVAWYPQNGQPGGSGSIQTVKL